MRKPDVLSIEFDNADYYKGLKSAQIFRSIVDTGMFRSYGPIDHIGADELERQQIEDDSGVEDMETDIGPPTTVSRV